MGSKLLGLILGVGIGAAVAIQARINGLLGARLHDGIAAAVISFGSGFLVLLLAVAGSKRLRAGLAQVRRAVRETRLRPWQLLGGMGGAFLVANQGLVVGAVGTTVFAVAVIAGQLVSSLVVDRLGIGPGGVGLLTGPRIAAALLGIVAVGVAGLGGVHEKADGSGLLGGAPSWLAVVLPALAGVGVAWQQAVNGRVGACGGPFAATVVNFGMGFAALLLVQIVVLLVHGLPAPLPAEPVLYLGGLVGIVFIATAALIVARIGVLLLGLTSVAGQLLTSLVLDWLLPTGSGLSPWAVLGCAVTLLAVAVGMRRPVATPESPESSDVASERAESEEFS